LLKRQRDAIGLSVFSENLDIHTPVKSSSTHHKLLYSELNKLLIAAEDRNKKTFAVNTLHQIAENIHRRSLVILFSDMIDNSEKSEELFSALQHLRYNKHEVILFHVTDKRHEIDLELENRPYHFIDLESGIELKAHPNEIRQVYTKAIADFQKELKLKCGQYKVEYIEAHVNQGFNTILLPYLIKRAKML
jgi:uncharacterized protein (DUF58 family)